MRLLLLRLLLALCASVCATGCAVRDYRDAPWDAKGHSQLTDVIPAWDDAAYRQCGSHLKDSERRGRSVRC